MKGNHRGGFGNEDWKSVSLDFKSSFSRDLWYACISHIGGIQDSEFQM